MPQSRLSCSPEKHRFLSSYPAKLLLLAGSVLFSIVLLEVILQTAGLAFTFIENRNALEAAGQPVEDEFRIVCLGESTTHGFGALSYPEILESRLRRQFGVEFRVINAGLLGQHSPFLAKRLELLIERHDPHMVIVMMGINDEFYFLESESLKLPIELQLKLLKFRTFKLARLVYSSLLGSARQRAVSALATPSRPPSEVRKFNQLSLRYAEPAFWEDHEDVDQRLLSLIQLARDASGTVGEGEDAVLKIDKQYLAHYYTSYNTLKRVYQKRSQPEAAVKLFSEAIERHPTSQFFYRGLAGVYEEIGELELAERLSNRAEELAAKSALTVTKTSYQRVERLLQDKGIVFVAMQYPLRSVATLKYLLDVSQYPIYVDNEAVFRAALSKSSYEEFFFDRFSGDIGHCTAAGNRLIVDNLIATVFEPIFALGVSNR